VDVKNDFRSGIEPANVCYILRTVLDEDEIKELIRYPRSDGALYRQAVYWAA
jgi:hypothetical protein